MVTPDPRLGEGRSGGGGEGLDLGLGAFVGGDPVHRGGLQPDPAAGLGQRLVDGHGVTGEAFRGTADDRGEPVRVALQQREASPVLQGLEQLGELELFAGQGQRVLVGGVERDLVLGYSAARMAAGAAPGSRGSPVRGCSSNDHSAVTGSP